MNDQELIKLVAARDETALAELEAKYAKRLGGIARGILRNEEDVSECLNDVYLKAWNSIPDAAPDDLGAWLSTLCRNTALSRVRDDNAQKRIPPDLLVPLEEETIDVRTAAGNETAAIAESRSEEERIKAVVNAFAAALPEKDRKVFVAHYYYDAAVKEIARRLGMPGGTVKSTLHRLRTGLARRLKEEGIDV